jgi:hypothetical protein
MPFQRNPSQSSFFIGMIVPLRRDALSLMCVKDTKEKTTDLCVMIAGLAGWYNCNPARRSLRTATQYQPGFVLKKVEVRRLGHLNANPGNQANPINPGSDTYTQIPILLVAVSGLRRHPAGLCLERGRSPETRHLNANPGNQANPINPGSDTYTPITITIPIPIPPNPPFFILKKTGTKHTYPPGRLRFNPL